jgi:hypothetical protein
MMKRRLLMVGFAMLTGLPHALWAKGAGKEDGVQSYGGWNTPYLPHYGKEGALQPLMEHLAAPAMNRANSRNWRLELAPPAVPVERDSAFTGRDKRVGFSLKLDF